MLFHVRMVDFPSSWPSSLSVESNCEHRDVTQTHGVWGAGVLAELEHIPGENTGGGGASLLPHRGARPVRPISPCRRPVSTMGSGHWAAVPLVQKCSEKALFQDCQDSRKNYCVWSFSRLGWSHPGTSYY